MIAERRPKRGQPGNRLVEEALYSTEVAHPFGIISRVFQHRKEQPPQIIVDATKIVNMDGENQVNEGYTSGEVRRRHPSATINPSNLPHYQPFDTDRKNLEVFKRLRACLLRKS